MNRKPRCRFHDGAEATPEKTLESPELTLFECRLHEVGIQFRIQEELLLMRTNLNVPIVQNCVQNSLFAQETQDFRMLSLYTKMVD